MSNSKWYSSNKIRTYNRLFSFILGMRSDGKTHDIKKNIIEHYKKTKKQSIYLRRYKTDFEKKTADITTFFEDIKEDYPKDTFEVKAGKFLMNGEVIGFYLPLSVVWRKKSVTTYANVDIMYFDEFIPSEKNKGSYLPDEITKFLEFYMTVDRYRGVKVYFVANAFSSTNPYFLYFKIKVRKNDNFVKIGKHIIVEIVQDTELKVERKASKFGELIHGTQYEKYAIDNEFYLDNDKFIGKKSKYAHFYATFIYNNKKFGIWISMNECKFWVSWDIEPNDLTPYCLTTDDLAPNTMLLKTNQRVLKMFVDNFKMGNVWYESSEIKNYAYEFMSLFSI